MKKALIAAAASAAMMIPSVALANHPTGDGPGGMVNQMNPDGFKNMGACQSALSKEINRQRMDADARVGVNDDLTTAEFQAKMLARFSCAMDDDAGVYRVYLTADL
ncbi:hypothetical protein [Croceicoccus naphthovorans]|uniref:Uncharacterized protein n=1 Tax=Croceicoccus naphthovorans TaxID=1348774 RepID=A0A0G3XFU7_9SPHN|nr:hypothetical protein [Croceicoccus naphthovorans]AKM10415.1 hypothetical protein AB433_11290 [Croceicoccus naphthovorans]MBB3990115.1 hypothetical protein [Croceicoccus naphthovorans]